MLTGVVALQLVLLLAAAGTILGRSQNDALTVSAKAVTKESKAAPAKAPAKPVPAAALPRRKVGVLVLNGNGRTGAAGAAASRVSGRGYKVRAVGNAPTTDYVHSIVMYRPGFKAEGARLARDLGVPIVGPLDGIRPTQMRGAHTVLILGA